MADGFDIVVGLDTKEVTKKLSDLQSKLKGMMGAQNNLGDSPRDMQMKQAFQRSEGIYRQKMIKEYESQGKIINEILKQEKELRKELDGKVKDQEKLNKLQQQYIQLTNQLRDTKDNQQSALQNICPPGMTYNPQTKQCVPDPSGGGGPGGGGFGGGPGGGGRGMMGKLTGLIGAVGSITAVAKSMTDMADFMNRRRGEYSAERSASLAESMYAPSRRAIRGEGLDDLLFAEEKSRALGDTMKMGEGQMGINRGMAGISGAAGVAGLGIGAAALLAAPFTAGTSLVAGAGLASMLPLVDAMLSSNQRPGLRIHVW
jgi:hypothetical protein